MNEFHSARKPNPNSPMKIHAAVFLKTKYRLMQLWLCWVLALFTLLTGRAAAVDFQSNSITAGEANVVFSRSATDTSGNIYVTGYYQNTFSYGGLSAPVLTAGITNFFLLKTDPAGNGLWLTSAQSTSVSSVIGTAITTDANGDVYIGLSCQNNTASPQTLIVGPTAFTINANLQNTIIAKFTQSAGAFVWAKTDPNSASSLTGLVATSDNLSVIATGDFQGAASFVGTPLITAQPPGARNTFLVKINASTGTARWAATATCAGGGYNRSSGIALDGSGNIYTTGYFGGVMFAGWSYQIDANSASLSNPSAYVVKWSNPATTVAIPQWAIGSTDTADSGTVAGVPAADANGNIYVPFTTSRFPANTTDTIGISVSSSFASGNYSQTNGGVSEGSIVKFDSNGNILWGEGTLGAASSTNSNTRIAVTTNFVYSLGTFGPGAVTFDGVTTLGTPGDSFIEQLSLSTGGLGFVARVNGSGATPSLLPQDLIASTGASGDTLDLVGTLAGSPSSNSFVAQYAVGGAGGPFTYTVNGGSNVTIIGYIGAGGAVTIPASILGLPVTAIDDYAFNVNSALTSVVIPNSVTSIGSGAFQGCDNLLDITIPNSVTSIGDYAFDFCYGLTSVTIGTNVSTIGSGAFAGDNLLDITIPNSVTSIGDYAFDGCLGLTNVLIGSGVTNIDYSIFIECFVLTNIGVDPANANYASVDGVVFNKALTTLVLCPLGLNGSYAVPNSVTNIGDYAFDGCGNLSDITIPNSVATIGSYAFANCSGLMSVTIGNSVISIGDFAFEDCALTTVTIPSSATGIGMEAFDNCSGLTNITFLGNAPTLTDGNEFYDDGVSANAKVYYYYGTSGWSTTYGGLATVELGLPNYSFTFTTNAGAITITGISGSGGAIIIPATITGLPVTGIGVTAFQNNTTITSLIISNGVMNIADAAFDGCTALTNVFIPDSVTNIGNSTFAGCSALVSVTGGSNVMSMGESAFNGCTSLPGIILSTNLASAGDFTFFNCTALQSIVIPASLTQLGNYMFDGCTGLTNVTLTNSLTGIGNSTFGFCSSLTSITIPNSVTSIGSAAFVACTALTNISLGNNITSIGDGAFNACHALASISLPTSLTSIGVDEFYNCSSLTNIVIPGSVTSIGGDAFDYCTALTSVTLPNSVTSIGDTAFENCSSLTGVYFQGNAPSLGGANVFTGVNAAATVYHLAGTTGWGATYGDLPTMLLRGAYNQISSPVLSGGNVQLSFIGNYGTKYALDLSFTLSPPNWIPQITNLTGAGGVLVFTNTPDTATNNFWRLRLVP